MEKSCCECRFFRTYYYDRGDRFFSTGCGYCRQKPQKRKRGDKTSSVKIYRGDECTCGLWENVAIRKESERQYMKKMLSEMAYKLKQIAKSLNADENETVLPIELCEGNNQ